MSKPHHPKPLPLEHAFGMSRTVSRNYVAAELRKYRSGFFHGVHRAMRESYGNSIVFTWQNEAGLITLAFSYVR